jgi:hypothetical protein
MVQINIINLIATFVSFILSALPLRRAAKILKIEVKFYFLLIIIFIEAIAIGILELFIDIFPGIIIHLASIYIYKKLLKIKFKKALLLWIVQTIVIIVSRIIFGILIDLFF